jgi:hypothetical protein
MSLFRIMIEIISDIREQVELDDAGYANEVCELISRKVLSISLMRLFSLLKHQLLHPNA